VVAGTPLPHVYTHPDVDLVKAGCSNLVRHIQNTRKYGVPVIVAINQFASDSPGGCS
jgi:formyltetrahydrofolate synthetase